MLFSNNLYTLNTLKISNIKINTLTTFYTMKITSKSNKLNIYYSKRNKLEK